MEVLRDLYQVILDSTAIPEDKLEIELIGDTPTVVYLGQILKSGVVYPKERSEITKDTVWVQILDFSLSINRDTEETVRNTAYLRQLELNVLFSSVTDDFTWQGRISDKLTGATMPKLLGEEFPMAISGDYLEGEPAFRSIILTSLSIFTLVAVLYFIRT